MEEELESGDAGRTRAKVSEILEVLEEGEKRYAAGPRDVILVIGNTGAGKSTLTQFIAGNDEALISKDTSDGLGIYTIEDEGGRKICSSTANSCTKVPELTVDETTGTAVYDCPGFSDTRGAAYEIAATYFTHRLVSYASRAKIVIVVPFGSLKKGGNRDDFPQLVKNVATMMPNVKEFAGSIALVVTQVDSNYRGGKLVDDDEVLAYVANFVKSLRNDLSARQFASATKTEQNGLNLIDLLLTNMNGSFYPRIGLFRRPERPGPLSNMKILQEEKESLRTLIFDRLQYARVDTQQFKYVVADKWKIELRDLLQECHKNVASFVQFIGVRVKLQHLELINQLLERRDDFDEVVEFSESIYNDFSAVNTSGDGLVFKKIFARIEEICQRAGMAFIHHKDDGYKMKYGEYIDFISSVSGLPGLDESALRDSLNDLVSHFDGVKRWYSFLKELKIALEHYEVQKNIDRFSDDTEQLLSIIQGPESWSLEDIHRSLSIIVNKVHSDVRSLTLMQSFFDVKSVNPLGGTLLSLGDALKVNLKYEVTYASKWDRLMISGPYIRATEVISKLSSSSAKFVEVFATKKIFLDEDIDATGRKLQLSIIAPTWEVIGERRILMDGSAGKEWPKASTVSDLPGSSGLNGKAGRPGGPAGGFFGVGIQCLNCEKLLISADGGQGGKGQDGGDGREGKDGGRPLIDDISDEAICTKDQADAQGKGILVAAGTAAALAYLGPIGLLGGLFMAHDTPIYENCTVDGEVGQRGGQGGCGNHGGYGGLRGAVNVKFAKTGQPIIRNSDGTPGENGSNGVAGQDGQLGSDLTFIRVSYMVSSRTEIKEVKHLNHEGLDEPPGPECRDLDHPATPDQAFAFSGLSSVIDLYLSTAREQLPHKNTSSLHQFLEYLQSSEVITALNENGTSILAPGLPESRSKRSAEEMCDDRTAMQSLVGRLSSAVSTLRPGLPQGKMPNDLDPRHITVLTPSRESLPQEIPALPGQSDNFQNDHSMSGKVNLDAHDVQSSLLLMDLLTRKLVRLPQRGRSSHPDRDDTYAQRMAYKAYAPAE